MNSCSPPNPKPPTVVDPCRKPEPCPPSALTISGLIEYYMRDYAAGLTAPLGELKNVTDYICGLHNDPTGPKKKYLRASHQFCIANRVISEMIGKLSGIDTHTFADFEELRGHVADAASGTKGYADLSIYDFAFRYGFNHGLLPERRVYVHAGAAKGAKALRRLGLIDCKITPPSIPIEAFAPILQEMGAMHLENFMCIVHRQLTEMADKLQSPSAEKATKKAGNKTSKSTVKQTANK